MLRSRRFVYASLRSLKGLNAATNTARYVEFMKAKIGEPSNGFGSFAVQVSTLDNSHKKRVVGYSEREHRSE